MRQAQLLALAEEAHVVLADHIAAPRDGEADAARAARPGWAPVSATGRCSASPRPAAAASPSASAVPDGASTLCR